MQREDDKEVKSTFSDESGTSLEPGTSNIKLNFNTCKTNTTATGSAFANLHQSKPRSVKSVVPKNRIDLLKWNGWGYKDSQFVVKDGIIHFTGNRIFLRLM